MCREVADSIVDLSAGVYDAVGRVGEARKVHPVFLTLELLRMFASYAVVYLKRVIVPCHYRKLAGVVEVEGCDRCLSFRAKKLEVGVSELVKDRNSFVILPETV